MFRIADGREHFYQWDLDRQIIVEDSSIAEVHFCNRTDECSLVVEVVDGLANVPNIILQKNYDFSVFGYDGKATRYDKVFNVKARTRPSDYVYTETEILSIEQLAEELRNDIDERLTNIAQEIILVLDADKIKTTEAPATEEQINFIETALADPARSLHVLQNGDNNLCFLNAIGGNMWEVQPYQNAVNMTRDRGNYNNFNIVFKKDSSGNWSVRILLSETIIASRAYVDNAIANLDIPEAEVDLSDYYTKEETYSKTEVDGLIPDTSNFATKGALRDAVNTLEKDLGQAWGQELTDLYTYVDDAIANIEIPEGSGGTASIYELVLPAAGEVITDEKTTELLANAWSTKVIPLCSYNGLLITECSFGNGSTTISCTAVKHPTRSTATSTYTEYDLLFTLGANTWTFTSVTESLDKHVTKTSDLTNDSDFTTKAYVDSLFEGIAHAEGGAY